MENEPAKIVLVDPNERWPLRLGDSTLYYRRLSIGALAALERQQAVPAPGQHRGQPPRMVIPPAALERAICAHVLLDWENVTGPGGEPLEYTPEAARMLPASVREKLVRAAKEPLPPKEI